MNTPVSFELAKLLKERGFDEVIKLLYNEEGTDTVKGTLPNSLTNYYSAPTIVEVVMWLYEKHEFWITVKQGFGWEYFIYETNVPYTEIDADGTFNSPTEAYEAAIEYVLKNLL